MLSTSSTFCQALQAYIRESAGGNKSLAARQLGVTRLQIYRYLKGGRPQPKFRRQMEGVFTVASSSKLPPLAHVNDTKVASLALKAIRYIERLVEADLARDIRASE